MRQFRQSLAQLGRQLLGLFQASPVVIDDGGHEMPIVGDGVFDLVKVLLRIPFISPEQSQLLEDRLTFLRRQPGARLNPVAGELTATRQETRRS